MSERELRLRFRINANTGQLTIIDDGLNRIDRNARNTTRSIDSLGSSLVKIGASVGGMLTIERAIEKSIHTSMTFEKSIDKLGAVTNATVSQIESLEAKALALGKSTEYSATQVSDAMYELGMSGMKTNEILIATKEALKLATIGSIDLATSANITSNIMGGLGLKASDMNRVVDVLSATITNATVDVRSLGETFKYTSSSANAVHATLEEVSAIAGVLGNVGVRGSMAGTAINSFFSRLASPPKQAQDWLNKLEVSTKDINGNLRNTLTIFGEIIEASKNFGNADKLDIANKLFGLEAGGEAIALMNSYNTTFKELLKTVSEADALNVSDKIYTQMVSNLDNSMKTLGSSIENLQIQATKPILEPLKHQIDDISASIVKFTDNNKDNFKTITENTLKLAGYVDDVVVAYGAFKVSGWIIAGVGALTTALEGVTFAQVALTGAITATAVAQRTLNLVAKASPYVLLATAIWGAYEAYKYFGDETKKVTSANQELYNTLNKMAEAGKSGVEIALYYNDSEITRVKSELDNATKTITDAEKLIEKAKSKNIDYSALANSIKPLQKEIETYKNELKDLLQTKKELLDNFNSSKVGNSAGATLCDKSCEEANQKIIDDITKQWVEATKSQEEQNVIWIENEIARIENSKLLEKQKYEEYVKLGEIFRVKDDKRLNVELETQKRINDKKIADAKRVYDNQANFYQEYFKTIGDLDSAWNIEQEKFREEAIKKEMDTTSEVYKVVLESRKKSFFESNSAILNETKTTANETEKVWSDIDLTSPITNGFESAFNDILLNGKFTANSLEDIFKSIGNNILGNITSSISKDIASGILGNGTKTGIGNLVTSGIKLIDNSTFGIGGSALGFAQGLGNSFLGVGALGSATGTAGALGGAFGAGMTSWAGGFSGVASTVGSAGSLSSLAGLSAGAGAIALPALIGYGLYKLGWSGSSVFEHGIKAIDDIKGYVDRDVEELKLYDSWKKKRAFSTKKWDTFKEFGLKDQIALNKTINPYESILNDYNKSIDIEAGKYNSKTLQDKLIYDFLEKFYDIDTKGVEDIKDSTLKNMYKEWESYAKSIDSTVQEAIINIIGTAKANIDNIDLLLMQESNGNLASQKLALDYSNKNIANAGDVLGVDLENWDLKRWRDEYQKILLDSTIPPEVKQSWNETNTLFIENYKANKEYNSTLKNTLLGVGNLDANTSFLIETYSSLNDGTLTFSGAVEKLQTTLGLTKEEAQNVATALGDIDWSVMYANANTSTAKQQVVDYSTQDFKDKYAENMGFEVGDSFDDDFKTYVSESKQNGYSAEEIVNNAVDYYTDLDKKNNPDSNMTEAEYKSMLNPMVYNNYYVTNNTSLTPGEDTSITIPPPTDDNQQVNQANNNLSYDFSKEIIDLGYRDLGFMNEFETNLNTLGIDIENFNLNDIESKIFDLNGEVADSEEEFNKNSEAVKYLTKTYLSAKSKIEDINSLFLTKDEKLQKDKDYFSGLDISYQSKLRMLGIPNEIKLDLENYDNLKNQIESKTFQGWINTQTPEQIQEFYTHLNPVVTELKRNSEATKALTNSFDTYMSELMLSDLSPLKESEKAVEANKSYENTKSEFINLVDSGASIDLITTKWNELQNINKTSLGFNQDIMGSSEYKDLFYNRTDDILNLKSMESMAGFDSGGYTTPINNIDYNFLGENVAGLVHTDEWVSPKWMTEHHTYGKIIRDLETIRQRGFSSGGYTTTVPTIPSTSSNNNKELLDEIKKLRINNEANQKLIIKLLEMIASKDIEIGFEMKEFIKVYKREVRLSS